MRMISEHKEYSHFDDDLEKGYPKIHFDTGLNSHLKTIKHKHTLCKQITYLLLEFK